MQPLVPADVDLTEFAFMPLDVRRLRDSKLAVTVSGNGFVAWMMLVCASWHQKPAASLPDDDKELANLSGFGREVKAWKKVRTEALYGWIRCDDGRFYHPVVADKALDAWRRRTEHAETSNNKTERQNRWRNRLKEVSDELRSRGITAPPGSSLKALETLLEDSNVDAQGDGNVDATVDGKASTPTSTGDVYASTSETGKTGTGTGTGTGQGKGKEPPNPRKRGDAFDASLVDIPAWLSRGLWVDWCTDRAARKKPITELGAKQQLQNLSDWHAEGLDAESAIRKAIAAGHQGLFKPISTVNGSGYRTPQQQTSIVTLGAGDET